MPQPLGPDTLARLRTYTTPTLANAIETMNLLEFVRGCTFDDFLLTPRLGVVPSRNPAAIDLTTRRLLGGLFEYRDLGGIEAKGFANRVQAHTRWRVRAWWRAGLSAAHDQHARRGDRPAPALLGPGEARRRLRRAGNGRTGDIPPRNSKLK